MNACPLGLRFGKRGLGQLAFACKIWPGTAYDFGFLISDFRSWGLLIVDISFYVASRYRMSGIQYPGFG